MPYAVNHGITGVHHRLIGPVGVAVAVLVACALVATVLITPLLRTTSDIAVEGVSIPQLGR